MKKLFVLFLALVLMLSVSVEAFAAADVQASAGGSSLGKIKTVTLANGAGTYSVTNISTSTIIPKKCEIIGYYANALEPSGLEGKFDIRDAVSTTSATDSYIISEGEVTSTVPTSQTFPERLEVSRGVTVHQGPQTCVTIYYVQVRP